MSNEKIRVRELASELGIQSREVVAAAKELGVGSDDLVAANNLSGTEADRLRSHFSGEEEKQEEVDVIVRRRSPKAKKTKDSDEAKTEISATAKKDAEAETLEKKPEPAKESKVEAKTQEPQKEAPKKAEAKPAPEPSKGQARIVRTADQVREAAMVEREKEKATAKAEEEAKKSAEEAKKAEEKAKKAAEEGKEREAKKEAKAKADREDSRKKETKGDTPKGAKVVAKPEAKKAKAQPKKSDEDYEDFEDFDINADDDAEESGPKVRVISRPDPREREERAEKRRVRRQAEAASKGRKDRQDAPQPSAAAPGGPASPASRDEGRTRKKGRGGRRTVDFSRRENEEAWQKATSRRRGRGRQKEAPKPSTKPQSAAKRKIKVEEFIRVSDLAHQMGMKANEVIKTLFNLGVMATINQSLDVETATVVAMEFGYEIEKVGFSEEDLISSQLPDDDPASLVPRPPVVTIMGHVDHGKTSLLDAVRRTSVVTGEAGGITQHIGAYHVKTKKGEIVFLDTPGHEAFTAMRARGAELTDIVVLVVAADDGVMEQTREAVSHAKAAGVPIMVAINKIDKPAAEPDRVKRELSEVGLVTEEWGGDTVFVEVSAKTGQGLDDLLDMLSLQAELLELKANPDRLAMGFIVEAKLDRGRGSLGTVLIQQGTLHTGDTFVCGVHSGRVRAMFDDQGKSVKEATPAMPVEVQGFEGVPEAGDEFICLKDESTARRIAESRALKQRERELARESKVTLETFLASHADDVEAAVLKLVIKADVQGSLEAIVDSLNKQSTDKVKVQVIHGGAGGISESDILLATASDAIVIGFNVRPSVKAKELAEHENVEIRFYEVIYKLVEEIHSAMEGMLAPIEREVEMGSAEVREIFTVPKAGVVAGSHVVDGKITRNAHVRLLRDGVVVHTGQIASLRRFTEDVREVQKGYECGIGILNFNDIKVGDMIEAYEIVEEAQKL